MPKELSFLHWLDKILSNMTFFIQALHGYTWWLATGEGEGKRGFLWLELGRGVEKPTTFYTTVAPHVLQSS